MLKPSLGTPYLTLGVRRDSRRNAQEGTEAAFALGIPRFNRRQHDSFHLRFYRKSVNTDVIERRKLHLARRTLPHIQRLENVLRHGVEPTELGLNFIAGGYWLNCVGTSYHDATAPLRQA